LRKLAVAFVIAFALSAVGAHSAGADPTKHFTGSFAIQCGGTTYVIVEKPGASHVITANGAPSNSVSVLFRLVIGGETIVDKPLPKTGHLQICTGAFDGEAFTAWTLITPG
jgi:hypothetical protein